MKEDFEVQAKVEPMALMKNKAIKLYILCDIIGKLSRDMMDLLDQKRRLIGMLMTDSMHGKGCSRVMMWEKVKERKAKCMRKTSVARIRSGASSGNDPQASFG